MKLSFINGHRSDLISIADRGLAFGDGVFTTGIVQNGRLLNRKAHIARLSNACKQLYIQNLDEMTLSDEIALVCKQLPQGNYVIKVIITAGESLRGYARNNSAIANRYIQIAAFPNHYKDWQIEGVNLDVASTQLGINPLLAGIKHLNRLEQVLIKREVELSTADDLLVTDIAGQIVETSVGNVFWLKDGVWQTPLINSAGVKGIMRDKVLSLVKDISEVTVDLTHLDGIQSMFICNCLMGIVPVKNWQDMALSIDEVRKFQEVNLNA